ncbi:MAG: LexA family transcriptional regulator [Candidatus Accumulibacter propinquus]|jgi:SOS-response transcriptional repressor LexA
MPAQPLTAEQKSDAARLKAIYEAKKGDLGLTQIALAALCGWESQGSVSQYLNGKIPLNIDAAAKLARSLKCSIDDFSPSLAQSLRNLGQPFPGHEKTLPANIEPGPDIRGAVPLISWVQAGDWSSIVDNFAPGDAEEWLPCPVSHGPRTYVLRVRGESMHNPHVRPSFADGDLIFVDPDRDAMHGSMVVVRLDDKREATFKRLVIEGDRRYLRALNPAWPDPIIQINGNATLCGVVILKAERV